jgi:hypothetical protein
MTLGTSNLELLSTYPIEGIGSKDTLRFFPCRFT